MEKELEKYIYALDLSLNSTGVCIFNSKEKCVTFLTIDTNGEKETAVKLKRIAEIFLALIKKYPPDRVIIEQGFSRYNKSTQQIFRVHGLINYLFCEWEQVYIPSSSIKKAITGKGNASKEEVRDFIKMEYPKIKFETFDESDAFATGYTYFIEQRSYRGKKNNQK